MISLRASEEGTALVVRAFSDEHNHEISQVIHLKHFLMYLLCVSSNFVRDLTCFSECVSNVVPWVTVYLVSFLY